MLPLGGQRFDIGRNLAAVPAGNVGRYFERLREVGAIVSALGITPVPDGLTGYAKDLCNVFIAVNFDI